MRNAFIMAVSAVLTVYPAAAADPAHPTVIELFQSQGCSSCPPANANLNAIADRADLLPLSFAVTYWDDLGWKDTFARPAFTARQWDYAHAGGRPQVTTPQMIVNGRGAIVGGNRNSVDQAIRQFDRGAGGPTIARIGGKVTISKGTAAQPATVWLVHYDPRAQNVPIRRGENGGRTLPHRNIVRALAPLGSWTGAPAAYPLPAAADPAWRSAILVQNGKGGAIVAASRI